jgi:hypothetical protein
MLPRTRPVPQSVQRMWAGSVIEGVSSPSARGVFPPTRSPRLEPVATGAPSIGEGLGTEGSVRNKLKSRE